MSDYSTISIGGKEEFIEGVKQWVNYDNKVNAHLDKVKELRKGRDGLGRGLTYYMVQNDLHKQNITISDGKIRCIETQTPTPLTFTYLEQCFSQFFPEGEVPAKLMQYIKERRGVKRNIGLKRYHLSKGKKTTPKADSRVSSAPAALQ